MKNKACIYKHTNSINGKVYVGSTKQSTRRRWAKANKKYESYKSCTLFFRALQKYGWDNFSSEVLEYVDEETMYQREEYYINLYDSANPEKGYNTKTIIEGISSYPLESRLKIAEKAFNRKSTPTNIIKHVTVGGVECKPCTTCKEIKSLSEYGKNKRSADGLHRYCRSCWSNYVSAYRKGPKLSKEELEKSIKERQTKSRPIVATNFLGEVVHRFPSTVRAKELGFSPNMIRNAIKHNKSYKELTWKYAEESYIRLNARDLEVKELSNRNVVRDFLEVNHVQGFLGYAVCYGLYNNDELVQVLSFGKPRFSKQHEWEIIRLATKRGHLVRGGFSKLLNAFIKNNNPKSIITYAKIGLAKNGKVYESAGFKFVRKTEPGYHYTDGKIYLSRLRCQKHKLFELLGKKYDPKKTEYENMSSNGYIRVEDEGNNVYELILNKVDK